MNISQYIYRTHDNHIFHFHDVPWGGRMSLKGTAKYTCMMLPVLSMNLDDYDLYVPRKLKNLI